MCVRYTAGANVRTMVEYCVLGGVNDSEACCVELAALMKGRDVIVNLIPYNPTDVPMVGLDRLNPVVDP